MALFQRLPNGRLFELETCAEDPVTQAPEAFEAALRWFIENPPGRGVTEFPVDPALTGGQA